MSTAPLLIGCGRVEPLAGVTGKVSIEETPLAAGVILFSSDSLGVHRTATIDDGTYVIVNRPGAGLPPGRYRVALSPPPVDLPIGPATVAPQPLKSNIPLQYQSASQSGWEVELAPGDNVHDFVARRTTPTR